MNIFSSVECILAIMGLTLTGVAFMFNVYCRRVDKREAVIKSEKDLNKILEEITTKKGRWEARASKFYNTRLNNFILFLNDFFGNQKQIPDHPKWWIELLSYYTVKSFTRSLFLAFFYPLISVACVWIINSNAYLGDLRLLPTCSPFWLRPLIFLIILASLFASYKSYITNKAHYFFAAVSVFVFGAIVIAITVPNGGAFAGAFADIGAIAIVGAIAGAIAGSTINFNINVITGVATVVVVGILSIVGAVVAIDSVISISIVNRTIAIIGAGVCSLFVMFLQYRMRKKNKEELFWITFISAMLITLLAINHILPDITNNKASRSIIIFMITLPIINAFFDWLSVGFTRFLLNHQHQGNFKKKLILLAIDLFAAFIFLCFLVMAMILFFKAMNYSAELSVNNAQWLNINEIINQMKKENPSNPGPPYWLYLTVLSTFIPTLIHIVVASCSVFTLMTFREDHCIKIMKHLTDYNKTKSTIALQEAAKEIEFPYFVGSSYTLLFWIIISTAGYFYISMPRFLMDFSDMINSWGA